MSFSLSWCGERYLEDGHEVCALEVAIEDELVVAEGTLVLWQFDAL